MTIPEMVRKYEVILIMDGENVCFHGNNVIHTSESSLGRAPAFKVMGYLTVSISFLAEGKGYTSEGVYNV